MGFLRLLCLALAVTFPLSACDDGHLRGSVTPSSDGNTYLSVVDDNGGGFGPIIVDGALWPFKIGEPGAISPGRHTLECGSSMEVDIPAGVVFEFEYWGP